MTKRRVDSAKSLEKVKPRSRDLNEVTKKSSSTPQSSQAEEGFGQIRHELEARQQKLESLGGRVAGLHAAVTQFENRAAELVERQQEAAPGIWQTLENSRVGRFLSGLWNRGRDQQASASAADQQQRPPEPAAPQLGAAHFAASPAYVPRASIFSPIAVAQMLAEGGITLNDIRQAFYHYKKLPRETKLTVKAARMLNQGKSATQLNLEKFLANYASAEGQSPLTSEQRDFLAAIFALRLTSDSKEAAIAPRSVEARATMQGVLAKIADRDDGQLAQRVEFFCTPVGNSVVNPLVKDTINKFSLHASIGSAVSGEKLIARCRLLFPEYQQQESLLQQKRPAVEATSAAEQWLEESPLKKLRF